MYLVQTLQINTGNGRDIASVKQKLVEMNNVVDLPLCYRLL